MANQEMLLEVVDGSVAEAASCFRPVQVSEAPSSMEEMNDLVLMLIICKVVKSDSVSLTVEAFRYASGYNLNALDRFPSIHD